MSVDEHHAPFHGRAYRRDGLGFVGTAHIQPPIAQVPRPIRDVCRPDVPIAIWSIVTPSMRRWSRRMAADVKRRRCEATLEMREATRTRRATATRLAERCRPPRGSWRRRRRSRDRRRRGPAPPRATRARRAPPGGLARCLPPPRRRAAGPWPRGGQRIAPSRQGAGGLGRGGFGPNARAVSRCGRVVLDSSRCRKSSCAACAS